MSSFKKAGILSVPSTTMSPHNCCHRPPPLTLAIPLRLGLRNPEITISWRPYKSRALRPFTIPHTIILPTSPSTATRCWIWVASLLPVFILPS